VRYMQQNFFPGEDPTIMVPVETIYEQQFNNRRKTAQSAKLRRPRIDSAAGTRSQFRPMHLGATKRELGRPDYLQG
jgi:hypothetical protein